jgi:uncharacterized protein (TIGR02145 family)
MANNLNVGTAVLKSQEQTNNGIIEKYCYNDDNSMCDTYGGLYQWDEMMDYTATSNANPSGRPGICPAGWHLPSHSEYCQMEGYLDPTVECNTQGYTGTDGGGKMKEAGTTHWASPNTGATNSSGFTGLPAGGRYPNGSTADLTLYTYFWTTTYWNIEKYWYHVLGSNSGMEGHYVNLKTFGFSVRCVKD